MILAAAVAAAVALSAAPQPDAPRADAPPPAAAPAGAASGAGATSGEDASAEPSTLLEPSLDAPARPAAQAMAEESRRQGSGWFALPVLFWLPETRLGYGGTGGLHFHIRDAARPSSIFGAAVYTLERQGSVDVAAEIYPPGGALISTRVRAVYFPDVYYGVGSRTRTSQREEFTRRYAEAVVTGELPIPHVPGLRAGPRLDLRTEDVRDVQPGGELASGTVPGASGYSAASVGASVTWDTRDNAFWTTRGSLAQAWYVYAPQAFGDHEPYGRGVLELRRFLPLGSGRVLGLHAYAEGAHGVTPFTLLPKLGSTRFLRGIREGRYRDRLDWVAQSELRVPVKWRLSAVAFAAIGDVAHTFSALTLQHPKVAGGAGVRLRLTDAGANIRVDAAISDAGPELYVLVLEAF